MEKLIFITNYRQACAYISDGIQPIRLEYNLNTKTLVFIFKQSDTKNVWQKWMNGSYKEKFKN